MDEYIYLGMVNLDGTLTVPIQCRTDARAPVAPDAAPSGRVYGPDPTATMTNGTFTASGPVDSQTGFYKGSVSCTSANGYASGNNYTIRVTYAVSSATKVQLFTFTVT